MTGFTVHIIRLACICWSYKLHYSLMLLLCAVVPISPINKMITLFAHATALIFVGQAFVRICYLVEEFNHLPQRYENSLCLLLQRIFSFNVPSYTILVLVFVILVYEGSPESCMTGNVSFYLIFVSCYIFLHVVIDVQQSDMNDAICLERPHGLDCGSSLAHSYYHGYLKIVLPDQGDDNRGIKEKISDYISKQGLTEKEFPVAKLFIIVFSSMYTSNDLSDMSCGWMEPAGNLEPIIKNRAGVMNRKYWNSVYRIKVPGSSAFEHTYVVAEGASPLRSLYDYTRSARIKRAHLKEVTALFFKTLLKILQDDREVDGLYELIYIDDESCRGVNVAEHIMQRIREITSSH